MSVDPLTKEYPWYTPYQFAGNKPIWAIDIDGLEEHMANDGNVIGIGPLKPEIVMHNKMDYQVEKELNAPLGIEMPYRKQSKNLRAEVEYVSQFSLVNPSVACWRASKCILEMSYVYGGNKTNLIQTAKENENHTSLGLTNKANEGVEYIDSQLELNKPVLVGVDHTLGKGRNEGTTDHFVVVTGRYYDEEKQKNFYEFYEVGTISKERGRSSKNKLYLDEDQGLRGENYSGKEYTVTQVRRNENL
jgi:hypothetical protein